MDSPATPDKSQARGQCSNCLKSGSIADLKPCPFISLGSICKPCQHLLKRAKSKLEALTDSDITNLMARREYIYDRDAGELLDEYDITDSTTMEDREIAYYTEYTRGLEFIKERYADDVALFKQLGGFAFGIRKPKNRMKSVRVEFAFVMEDFRESLREIE